ncbi:MAG: class I SAM-dependent methyltransferase [Gammaproteobacteria bacterium]|nr:class I SAM-dependent methyltransferase [Gammaproteobacteria bacterium]
MRAALCYELSRRRLAPPEPETVVYGEYQAWRVRSLSGSWHAFSDADVAGKDVLDFGCGDGALSFHLAQSRHPRSVLGLDLYPEAVRRATEALCAKSLPAQTRVEFMLGSVDGIPLPDGSIDTIVALDCLEHVMSPLRIFREWHRILRPGGKCLIEWFPYKGPWGPHMESLIPIPWAHVIFGQEALFRAAERIYDLPQFVPRHWDLDAAGARKPNKWRAWSSFKEQGYINELDLRGFRSLVHEAGLRIERMEKHSFGGAPLRRSLGRMLMSIPVVGEYFLSFALIELRKSPAARAARA